MSTERSATARFDGNTITVSGSLNFDSVIDLDQQVSAWLRGKMPADCIVDLSGVHYSNSAGIALLLGWMRIAQQSGSRLLLPVVPVDMQGLAEVGGLAELFAAVGP